MRLCTNIPGWSEGGGYPDSSDETYMAGDVSGGNNLGEFSFINPKNCTEGEEDVLNDLGISENDNIPLIYFYNPSSSDIFSSLKWTFLLHSYAFACLFFFLAFFAFFSILNLRSQLSTRPYMSTVNSFLCLLGVTRSIELFIDPYGLKRTLPPLMATLLWDLGFPCLISSFSLLQIVFYQLTQIEVGPETLRKKTCLSIFITVHFVMVIGTAIYSNINSDLVVVRLAFQLGFSLWGLILFVSFLYTGKKYLDAQRTGGGSCLTVNEKGVAGLMAGIMGPGQNLASSLTAALAPTLLQSNTPKIKVTDENDKTVPVGAESLKLNDIPELSTSSCQNNRPSTPISGPSIKFSSANPASHVRPPSPVLPRKKSGGGAIVLRNGSTLSGITPGVRKKSLTWSENESQISGKDNERATEITSLISNSNDKRKGSRKSVDVNSACANDSGSERSGQTESLLMSSGGPGPDFTLQSILSHIAYVNQTALDYRLSRKLSRSNQVQKLIRLTGVTAIFGILLCIGELIRVMSPYGFLASTKTSPQPWFWFALQNFSRMIEFGMGATVANIAKQPAARPHHYAAYSLRHKHQRESLYL